MSPAACLVLGPLLPLWPECQSGHCQAESQAGGNGQQHGPHNGPGQEIQSIQLNWNSWKRTALVNLDRHDDGGEGGGGDDEKRDQTALRWPRART